MLAVILENKIYLKIVYMYDSFEFKTLFGFNNHCKNKIVQIIND